MIYDDDVARFDCAVGHRECYGGRCTQCRAVHRYLTAGFIKRHRSGFARGLQHAAASADCITLLPGAADDLVASR